MDSVGLRWLTTNHIEERVIERLNTRRFKFPEVDRVIRLRYCGVRGWAWFSDFGVSLGSLFPQQDGTVAYVAKTVLTRQQFFKNVEPTLWRFPKSWRHFTVLEAYEIGPLGSLIDGYLQLTKKVEAPPEWVEVEKRLAKEREAKPTVRRIAAAATHPKRNHHSAITPRAPVEDLQLHGQGPVRERLGRGYKPFERLNHLLDS